MKKQEDNTMDRIEQLLNVSSESYKAMIFDTYRRWCMDFCSEFPSDLQRFLANSALNKYFLDEYKLLENEFLYSCRSYDRNPQITFVDKRILYASCTHKIFSKRSPELINKARTLNIINHDTRAN